MPLFTWFVYTMGFESAGSATNHFLVLSLRDKCYGDTERDRSLRINAHDKQLIKRRDSVSCQVHTQRTFTLNLSRRLDVSGASSHDLLIRSKSQSGCFFYKLLFYSRIHSNNNFFYFWDLIFASFFKFFAVLNPICTYYFRIKNARTVRSIQVTGSRDILTIC